MKHLIAAVFAVGVLSPFSATADVLDDVITRCVNQETRLDYVVYKTKVKDGKTYLTFGRGSKISDAEKAAVRSCIARSGVRSTSTSRAEPVLAFVPRTRVTKRGSGNALCPKHAPTLYRGTRYCIGNQ